ncbi:hypothetical protein [Helicobacter sp. T3_23-1056]
MQLHRGGGISVIARFCGFVKKSQKSWQSKNPPSLSTRGLGGGRHCERCNATRGNL